MTYVPYNITGEELELLKAWPTSESKPAVFLTVPAVRDVGERELIEDLCALAYEAAGYVDAPARHRLMRNYPHEGSAEDYAHFTDDPIIAAEVTNEFRGIDCIDLTAWLGQALDSPYWTKFLNHVRPSDYCDYILVAHTDRPELVDEIVQSIMSRCGIAVLRVAVLPPTRDALVAAFMKKSGSSVTGYDALVGDWIDCLLEEGKAPNYSYVSTVATMTTYACDTWASKREGLTALLEQQAQLAPSATKTHRIGF